MGVETGGPSEENLRIRTEVNEPETRIKNVDRARKAAQFREWGRNAQSLADTISADNEAGKKAKSEWQHNADRANRNADISELDPDSPEALKMNAETTEEDEIRFKENNPDYAVFRGSEAKKFRERAEAAEKEGK